MEEPRLIQLPKFLDDRGNLSFFENENQLPFAIKRVHWIYDVPGGEERGGVAYKTTEEFIVAMSGSFDVVAKNSERDWKFTLNRSYMGVYIPAGYWRAVVNYSSNSVALIAASTFYDPSDAIRYMDKLRAWTPIEKDNNDTPYTIHHTPAAKHSVQDCGIIELDRHHSQRKGDISVVENGKEVPFDVKRIYYLYDVPGGADRGGHAHKELCQLIIAASGSFTVTLDDGNVKRTFMLNRPYQGLLIKPGIWRDLRDFSSGSVCMVLASEKYSESDYIREYNEFLKYRAND
jgi:dTDP-4-dehydrorhamnose 3,5-epimerase-like enzyme